MALIDDTISLVNQTLLANLPWLNNSYGKIQRLKRQDARGVEVSFPGIFIGPNNDDYIALLPDRTLGNYSYFEVPDPVEYENMNRSVSSEFEFKLVFWFDWRDIFPADWRQRSIEEVKQIILDVLMAAPGTRTVEIFKVYEDANTIFQSFTYQGYISSYDHKAIDGQFLMRPYGGLAFTGKMRTIPSCNGSIAPVTIPQNIAAMIPVDYSTDEQVWPYERFFGETIYWRTYFPEGAQFEYVQLDGLPLPFNGHIVRSQASNKSITSNAFGGNSPVEVFFGYPGSETHLSVQIPFESNEYRVTIWYTKQ